MEGGSQTCHKMFKHGDRLAYLGSKEKQYFHWCFRLIDMRLGTFQYSTHPKLLKEPIWWRFPCVFIAKKSIENLNASFFKSSGAII